MPLSELLILHHTHTDIGYTNPQSVFWHLSRQFIDQAIDLCEATSHFPEESRARWTCEVTSTVVDWLDHAKPDQIQRMRSLVQAGQIGFGAMWCHWGANIREDSFSDSLLPIRRIRDELGGAVNVAITHDVNGLPWSSVEMLLDAGVQGLLMGINIHFGGYPLQRPMAFHWKGASGRSIPVFSGEHYNTFNRFAKPQLNDLDRAQKKLDHYLIDLQTKGYELPFAFLTATNPFCDDNNPPDPELPTFIRRWNDEQRSPRLRLVTPDTLFQRLRDLPAGTMPTHSGDWPDYWSFGCGGSALELQASRMGHDALWDARLLGATTGGYDSLKSVERCAAHEMAIADEHTFGAYCSTSGLQTTPQHEPIPVAEQWYPKGAAMFGVLSNARLLRREILDGVAENPPRFNRVEGVLVLNPAQIARRTFLRIPRGILNQTQAMFNTNLHKLDVFATIADDSQSQWVGPFDLPPMSVRSLPIAQLLKAIAPDQAATAETTLNSPWFELTLDPSKGRIISLKDRSTGAEVIDAISLYGFFEPIVETVAKPSERAQRAGDLRMDLYDVALTEIDRVHENEDCWVRDWKPNHVAGKVIDWQTSSSPIGAVLKRTIQCDGIKGQMVQTITLSATEPRVIFEAYFNKADRHEPDALYFAFPFALAKAQLHYETAGQAVIFDDEQLPGACRDFVTSDSYIAVANQDRCITLACPDSPFFQVGKLNFGRGIKSKAGLNQATVFAWPMNNYWNTNYRVSQPGHIRLRYEMTTSAGFDAAACSRFAGTVGHQVVWHPVAECPVEDLKTLIDVDPKSVTITQVKNTDDGKSIVVRLRNHGEAVVGAKLRLPTVKIAAAHLSNSLEEMGQRVSVQDGAIALDIQRGASVTLLVVAAN